MKRRETVTRVVDGDTFQTASRKKSIRLANVDAPERGTRRAAKATEALRKIIKGEKVRVEAVARDKYGRAVANVYIGRESVNKKMRGKIKKK